MKAVFACNEDLGGGVLSSLIGSPELPELHVLSTPWSHEQGFCSFLLSGDFTFMCGLRAARRCTMLYLHGWCVSDGACYMNP